jgi:hypothetical protein
MVKDLQRRVAVIGFARFARPAAGFDFAYPKRMLW